MPVRAACAVHGPCFSPPPPQKKKKNNKGGLEDGRDGFGLGAGLGVELGGGPKQAAAAKPAILTSSSAAAAAAAVEEGPADLDGGGEGADGGGKGGSGDSGKKGGGLRRGKWTPEEENYANRLIDEFKSGLLPLTDGTTLRTFLSKVAPPLPCPFSPSLVPALSLARGRGGFLIFKKYIISKNMVLPPPPPPRISLGLACFRARSALALLLPPPPPPPPALPRGVHSCSTATRCASAKSSWGTTASGSKCSGGSSRTWTT